MIPRIESTALEWAYDARYLRRPRNPAIPVRPQEATRDIEDRIILSPAALRLLDQSARLARRGDET